MASRSSTASSSAATAAATSPRTPLSLVGARCALCGSAEAETEAAARLYDSFGPSLFRYALMILGRREAAEDVIQQVFVALIDRGTGHVADPRTYLRAAVRNACFTVAQWTRARTGDGCRRGDPRGQTRHGRPCRR